MSGRACERGFRRVLAVPLATSRGAPVFSESLRRAWNVGRGRRNRPIRALAFLTARKEPNPEERPREAWGGSFVLHLYISLKKNRKCSLNLFNYKNLIQQISHISYIDSLWHLSTRATFKNWRPSKLGHKIFKKKTVHGLTFIKFTLKIVLFL